MFANRTMTWQGEALDRSVELGLDATLILPHGRGGTVIRVERGVLVVTREGDGEDHVLEAGMELTLPRAGRAVAWALAPSRFILRDGRAAPRANLHRPARAAA